MFEKIVRDAKHAMYLSDTRRLQNVMVVSETTNNTLSTGMMVLVLMGVVKGVFICFALMAICYRYSSKIKLLSGFDQRLSLSSNSVASWMMRHRTRPSNCSRNIDSS